MSDGIGKQFGNREIKDPYSYYVLPNSLHYKHCFGIEILFFKCLSLSKILALESNQWNHDTSSMYKNKSDFNSVIIKIKMIDTRPVV